MSADALLTAAVVNAQHVNSFAADMSIQGSGTSAAIGNVTMSGTFEEQQQPSLLVEADFGTLEAAGQSIGPMDEILNKQDIYLKMPIVSKLVPGSKPWLEIPVSELKSGASLGELLGEVQSSDPLSDARLLTGATNVRTVGTGTVNGVAVTELAGSESASAALAKLPASLRTTYGSQISQLGIREIKFQAWVDGQHNIRKQVITETGSSINETITVTVTSINQPVTITVPTASQTTQLPASALGSAGA